MTRDDLERLDMPSLRTLARKHLPGRGRKLRGREALLSALTRSLSSPPAAEMLPPPRKGAARAPAWPGMAEVGQRATPPPSEPPGHSPRVERPVEEGFFAPSPGRRRTPPRSPAEVLVAPPSPAAADGEPLPGRAEDLLWLLARDSTTLFLFWDFRGELERGGALGLRAPRLLFRLYDGAALVRTVEAPAGKRSLYLEGLEPGHTYAVEAWWRGSDGEVRPTGRRSAPLGLAPAEPSQTLEVRTVRVRPGQPLSAWRSSPRTAGRAERVEPLGSPVRVELPSSMDWRGGPRVGGPLPRPRSGRP